jgi:glycosyltransferase involved in cell wall biosynthesis
MPNHPANLEGLAEYDIRWGWAQGKLQAGFTAVVRAKNEARNLPFVLPPLLRSLARVLLIDNGSTDGTAETAQRIATDEGASDRLEVVAYPFAVSRCGTEHLQTPPESVHSLTYFYNWAFSQVRTTYALKWDGDMVLTGEGESILSDLAWQLEGKRIRIFMMTVPLYVQSASLAYIDFSIRHFETYGWPNAVENFYRKALEWELIRLSPDLARHVLPDGICFELKWLDSDEFSHWSHRDFDRTPRTSRKAREWRVINRLRLGQYGDGLVPVVPESDQHVVTAVRQTSVTGWQTMRSAAINPPSRPAVGLPLTLLQRID